MTDAAFEWLLAVAALGYTVSMFLIGWRGLVGPNSLDRLVALDALVSIIQGALAVYMVWTADTSVAYAMVAVALLGYLSSVSVARFRTPDSRRTRESDEADRTGLWKQEPAVKLPRKGEAGRSEVGRPQKGAK